MVSNISHSEIMLLSSFIEGTGQVILVTDSSVQKVLLCNILAEHTFGLSKQQLEGIDFSLLEADKGVTLKNMQENASNEYPISFIGDFIIAGGAGHCFLVTCNLIPIYGESIVSLTLQELGLLGRIPKGKVGNLHIFEKFFEKNSIPILLLDFNNLQIIDANHHAQKFFGLPVSKLVGSSLESFTNACQDDFTSAIKKFVESEYTGLELTLCTVSMGCRDVEVHYTLFSSGAKKRLLCLLVDITNRNQALSELREVKNSLYNEVSKQTKDLIRINNSLIDQIANRRIAEDQLRQSQEMFLLVFQFNPSGMILKDIKTSRVVEVNNSFIKTFGYHKTEVVGKTVEELAILCDQEQFKELQSKLLIERLVRRVPISMVSKLGHAVFAMYSGEILKLRHGEFALEVFHDVTETSIIQQKLAIREEQYRTMFNNALVGINRTEVATGIVISCNQQFARMLGYKAEDQVIGKSFNKHFSNQADRRNFVSQLLEKGTVVTEFELRTANDQRIWVVDYATINTKERFIDEVVVDITDRKLMEDLLASNENRFRSMIENASDLILIVNAEGKFMYISPSVRKELGYPIERYGGQTVFQFIAQEDTPRISALLKGELAKSQSYEVSIRHSEGYYRTYEFRATNLLNDSALGGIVINARDITEQIKARNELNLALQKEQELSRQKTQFISTVSHEFRTPLTNVSLNLQMLSKYFAEGRFDKAKVNIERIVNAEKRLTALLNEISLISRDQSGRLQYNPEQWDLHLLLDDLLEQVSYLIQPNVRVDMHKPSNQQVNMDKNLLQHIVGNLLSNAIKYSEKGSEVFLRMGPNEANDLEIFVKDHGIGIPEAELSFLFDPYFRASNAKSYTGSGLGLSIVKRCVDLHGGQFSVKSVEGKGTSVRCTIPLISNGSTNQTNTNYT